jgi:hypothetical protein
MDLLIAMSLLFVFGLHNSLVKKLFVVFEHLEPAGDTLESNPLLPHDDLCP